MKKYLLLVISTIGLYFTGCLEIEDGITLNENGSGTMELKTDMSQLITMLKMSGAGKGEIIKKDTVITYKSYLDTAQSITAEEKELLYNTAWRVKMDSEEEIFTLILTAPFKKPGDVSKIMAAIDKMDKVDIMNEALKDIAPGGGAMDLDEMGMGKGGSKNIGDMTKDYFITSWQNGKLVKRLDTLAYKKIAYDENLNGFKKLGELAPGGEDILENINVITKFTLPRPATKAEGKSLKISDDKKTITIKSVVSDIYDKPQNFEYSIEY